LFADPCEGGLSAKKVYEAVSRITWKLPGHQVQISLVDVIPNFPREWEKREGLIEYKLL
jgi:hypothetical protein